MSAAFKTKAVLMNFLPDFSEPSFYLRVMDLLLAACFSSQKITQSSRILSKLNFPDGIGQFQVIWQHAGLVRPF